MSTIVYIDNFDRVTMLMVYLLFVIPFAFLFIRSLSSDRGRFHEFSTLSGVYSYWR
ncbi:hypothetical protein [Mesotoga sp. Brook.08.YT.4.2.5.1]|uniref:hypothetical protein n=1 Tax=Mesotoga sp. Brook.08.YT.4.2.5.1 TaxID=1421001 RepID=UPI00215512EE|nr:hypothetical protein [Mesotoga sp. Brook.08.YT.4.2.5.1]